MKQYTGMRKGISLVEMTIAIVLFAALAAIGLKYSKVYLNTDLQAKKARVAAATDQASQLVQAYQIYKTELGTEPTSISDLNGSAAILTKVPTKIAEMSTIGWEVNTTTGLTPGTGVAFQMTLDKNSTADKMNTYQYCALWNREFNSSTALNDLNTSKSNLFGTAAAKYATQGNSFCYSIGNYKARIMVVVP